MKVLISLTCNTKLTFEIKKDFQVKILQGNA